MLRLKKLENQRYVYELFEKKKVLCWEKQDTDLMKYIILLW